MPTVIRFQVIQPNKSNIYTIMWFQVFQSNINNLYTVIWFQVFQSNTNNMHTDIWFQVYQSNINNMHTVTWFQVRIYSTPPSCTRCDTRSIFKWNPTSPVAGWRIVGSIPYRTVLASRIWPFLTMITITPRTPLHMVSSNYSHLIIIIISLLTVIWFQLFLSDANNF